MFWISKFVRQLLTRSFAVAPIGQSISDQPVVSLWRTRGEVNVDISGSEPRVSTWLRHAPGPCRWTMSFISLRALFPLPPPYPRERDKVVTLSHDTQFSIMSKLYEQLKISWTTAGRFLQFVTWLTIEIESNDSSIHWRSNEPSISFLWKFPE